MTAGNTKYFPKFSNIGRQKYSLCSRLEEEQWGSRVDEKCRQNSAATATPLISVPQWASSLFHSTTSSPSPSSNLAFVGMPDMGQFPLRMDWNLLKLFPGHRLLLHLCGGMKNLARGFSHCRQRGKFLVSIVCFGKPWYIGNYLLSLDSRLALFLTC